jgi:hypothetical protein
VTPGATTRRLICVVVVAGAAACSSTSKAAGPTPHPPSATTTSTASARAYLTGAGSAIVTVERASQDLAAGTRPSRAACTAFLARASSIIGAPAWARAVRGVPDPALRAAIVADLNDKVFLARACVSTTGLNESADERRVYRLYRDRSRAVATRLAAIGVPVS